MPEAERPQKRRRFTRLQRSMSTPTLPSSDRMSMSEALLATAGTTAAPKASDPFGLSAMLSRGPFAREGSASSRLLAQSRDAPPSFLGGVVNSSRDAPSFPSAAGSSTKSLFEHVISGDKSRVQALPVGSTSSLDSAPAHSPIHDVDRDRNLSRLQPFWVPETRHPVLPTPTATQDEESSFGVRLRTLPRDFSLKTRVKIVGISGIALKTMAMDTRMSDSAYDPSGAGTEAKIELLMSSVRECTKQWRFPAADLPLPVLEYMQTARRRAGRDAAKASPMQAFVDERRASWRVAFRSAFHQFRSGRSRSFYYIATDLVVAFVNVGTPGLSDSDQGSFRAVMSRSSRSLRQALLHYDVPFDMPLDQETLLKELDSRATQQPAGAPAAVLTRNRLGDTSVLHFPNLWACQCLFDFLMSWSPASGTVQGVPVLQSSTVFEMATFSPSQIECRWRSSDASAGFSIRGMLPPDSVHTLASALKRVAAAQGSPQFSMHMSVHPQSIYFNHALFADELLHGADSAQSPMTVARLAHGNEPGYTIHPVGTDSIVVKQQARMTRQASTAKATAAELESESESE